MNMREILIIIDCVNDILHPDGALAHFGIAAQVANRATMAKIKRVLATARQQRLPIIWVRVAFTEGYPELVHTQAPFYLVHKQNGWLQDGTWGTEFYGDLQPMNGERVITKHRVNPFTSTEFTDAVAAYDRLILAGVSTNLAIEETVRTAAAKDFEVVVLEDCCAGSDKSSHDFAIQKIFSKFAKIITCKEFLQSHDS
jgi:nicotinamidase-related amidase